MPEKNPGTTLIRSSGRLKTTHISAVSPNGNCWQRTGIAPKRRCMKFALSWLLLSTTAENRGMTIPNLFRSEEHTSELQSRPHLVCRLLLEKKKKIRKHM